jgi:predicted glycogen debranching enzyme
MPGIQRVREGKEIFMIEFGRDICTNLDTAASREWLETNGLGGFASSSIAGLNTRRYHGLLVAATKPPVGRMVLLSKLEETVIIDGEPFDLAANQYPGTIHPQGYRYLASFRIDPYPIFTYHVEGLEIEKSIFMVHGENTTVIDYRIRKAGEQSVALELRPLIAFRDYHSTAHENGFLDGTVAAAPGLVRLQPYQGVPHLYLAHSHAEVEPASNWYHNFEYRIEQERGLDFREDLFNPCVLRFRLNAAASARATVIASTQEHRASEVDLLRSRELARRTAVAGTAPSDQPLVRQLTLAADQYIVSRGEGKTIIAGYPWFSDWGRDTMISLPGLTLTTGRYDIARDVLLAFAASVDQGMLPNRFPDAGEAPEYNTVDAALWYFEAVRAYLAHTGDYDFVREHLYPVLADIIAWHVRGTRHGIRVDPNGLLAAGEPGVQLTWMDAKIGDWVVTPRHGKPVEIQALWYNALRIMESLAHTFASEGERKRYNGMAEVAKWSFNRLFWNESAGCLYDVVNGGPPDPSIRPNQIFAVSLYHSMLSAERARAVVETVRRDLLTPFGVRSLAPSDPKYAPHYAGDPRSRDSAYHQGTVWPWLLGPFLTAYVKISNGSAESRQQAAGWLRALQEHLAECGLGQISEVFDAEPPFHPGGCPAQAWSVAELLRAAVEEIFVSQAPEAKIRMEEHVA